MDEEIYKKLSELANQLSSMTFVLNAYCENYEQSISEIAYLTEFSQMMHKTAQKIYDLL